MFFLFNLAYLINIDKIFIKMFHLKINLGQAYFKSLKYSE